MRVIVTKNYQEMSAKAARFVLAQLWRNPKLVLGAATGATPVGFYKELVAAYQRKQADFKQVVTFNLDEYLGLSPDDSGSYHQYMRRHLFSKVAIPRENQHLPQPDAHDPNQACEAYEQLIREAGGIGVQLLGIAPNGHIGFNEPGTPFGSRTHVTELTSATRAKNAKYFASKRTPAHAITMGLATIMEARRIVLLASGKEKARAIAQALEARVTTAVPASILQWHPNVTVILDAAAASQLTKNYQSLLTFHEGDVELLRQDDLPAGERIAVISPHPDDASISLGGVIAGLAKKNQVHIVVMTAGYRSVVNGTSAQAVTKIREAEAKKESKILGTRAHFLHAAFYDDKHLQRALLADTKKLAALFGRIKPTMVLVPQRNDRHPTHRTSREVALASLDRYEHKSKQHVALWSYEGLWSLFAENEFNTIFAYGSELMKKKRAAIAAQKSQITRTRFDVAAEALARLRAAIVPEQALVGYGAKAPKLGTYFELFDVER